MSQNENVNEKLDVQCATCGEVHALLSRCDVVETKEEVVNEKKLENATAEQLAEALAALRAQIEALKGNLPEKFVEKKETTTMTGVPKNHRPGKPQAGRKYVLLSKSLSSWGRIPQQQADLAKTLVGNLEVGKEYGEAEVFDILMEKAVEHASIRGSIQDPTYLFRYYRGLKNDGKRAGFIARNFLRVIG
jgi:hypothetical protein